MDDTLKRVISSRIRRKRENAFLIRKQLAEACGVSEWSIENLEAGSRLPTVKTLIALAGTLKTTPSYLLGFKDDTDLLEKKIKELESSLALEAELIESSVTLYKASVNTVRLVANLVVSEDDCHPHLLREHIIRNFDPQYPYFTRLFGRVITFSEEEVKKNFALEGEEN